LPNKFAMERSGIFNPMLYDGAGLLF